MKSIREIQDQENLSERRNQNILGNEIKKLAVLISMPANILAFVSIRKDQNIFLKEFAHGSLNGTRGNCTSDSECRNPDR